MSDKCEKCNGDGYIYIIFKARSVGISTMSTPGDGKVPCPKCGGNPWWMRNKAGVTQ
jgi:hypothetical protein